MFYLLTEVARKKMTAVLILGRDTDVSTHLFLKNAVGFLMTISSTTLIFKCHPKCSSYSLLCRGMWVGE